ncbi:MAG: hypothetical protein CGW95_01135 [Phenylobacterium zucineum]|nr:MAG: hypothetical protein CGW95_01135 [Phenylobacterium zucineum]
MANVARGEVELQVGGGAYHVALNLGTLAELEDAFGVDSFEDALNTVFTDKLSAKRLIKFLTALFKGNGIEITEEVTKHLRSIEPQDLLIISNVLLKMMNASGLSQSTEGGGQSEGESPLPAASVGSFG